MKKWVKRILYFLGGLLILILLLIIFIQTPYAKKIIRNKLQIYLSEKTHSKVSIGAVDFSLPKWVELKNVYWRDLSNDTLLYGEQLRVDIAMFKLIKSDIDINKIELINVYVNLVKAEKDTTFNYQFIIDAFTSKKPSAKTDTTPTKLSIGSIMLSKVRFNMLDYNAGSLMKLSVDSFEIKMNEINFDKQEYDVKNLYADKLFFTMQILKAAVKEEKPEKESAVKFPLINLTNATIKNSSVLFEDKPSQLLSKNTISLLEIENINNKKDRNFFKGESLSVSNSTIEFKQASNKTIVAKKKDTVEISTSTALSFQIDEINLTNNNITYDDISKPKLNEGLDYNHLNIANLVLVTKNNLYSGDKIQSSIQRFAFADISGFKIDSAKGEINIDSNQIAVKNFILQTPHTKINAQANVFPASFITAPTKKSDNSNNELILTNTIIGRKDLDLLAGSIAKKYKNELDEVGDLSIDSKVEGNAAKLYIQQFNVTSSASKLHVQLKGSVYNATNTKNLKYNIAVQNITAPGKLISRFVNKEKQLLQLPPVVLLKGNVAGTMQYVDANITTNSAYGMAVIKAKLNNFTDVKRMKYDVAVNAKDFQTGKWVYMDSLLGKLTGNIAVKGSNGFDLKQSIMQVKTDIQSFVIKANNINNIKIDGSLNKGLIATDASIKDELINLSLKATGNVQSKYPTGDIQLNVVDANLLALGLTTDTLTITSFTKIKLDNTTPQNLNSFVRIDSTVIKRSGQKIIIDSAVATALVRNDSTIITINAPFTDTKINSTVYYNEMLPLIQQVSNHFIPSQTQTNQTAKQGVITADIIVKPSETFRSFVKGIQFENNILVKAKITNTSVDSLLKATVAVADLKMNGTKLANLNADVLGKGDSLTLNLTADTLQQGNIILYNALVKAGYSKDNFTAFVSTKDLEKKEQFHLTVSGNKINDGYVFKMGEDLLLNYQKWLVNKQNEIKVAPGGFNVKQFDIQSNEQKIAVNSETEIINAPVNINIENFKIRTIASLANQDSLQADGLINVKAKLSDFNNSIPTVEGTIKVDSLVYQNSPVGNLHVQAKSSNGNVTVSGKLEGNGNNVDLSGTYNENNIDAKINLNPINFTSIQAFTAGNLTRSSGYVRGAINITGPVSEPKWNGELNFDNAKTTAKQYGTTVIINNQKLVFDYPSVSFNKFTITDTANNKIVIDGTLAKKEDNFIADLDINARNFTALNSAATDNNFLYGTAIVDINATVKGSLTAPDIAGSVKLKNKTDVTYAVQNSVATAKEREGVMEFVDMDTIPNLLRKNTMVEALLLQQKRTNTSSLNYNLNITIEPEAKFNVVVDPNTRDMLQVQGSAELNASVNPNGSVALVGTYKLSKGSYDLHYQFITRKFILQDSSTVTLTGDPSKANVDIAAVYNVAANANDLVGNEVQGTTGTNNSYNIKVPFQVILKIKGSVEKPKLSFDIQRQPNAEGLDYNTSIVIDNKLTQLRGDESSMNKQVFALLIMNRFIGEQSRDFFANSSSSNSLLSNSSVSSLLTESLNQIAADLIQGIDVDINLDTKDVDPTKQHTDLSVALSKKFLDDRLSVSVGKSFTVEGNDPTANAQNSANNNIQFIPDINSTYKLSNDGRYMIRVYRRNQYEAIMDGYFVETGVAFSLTMDYNKLKELFNKKRKKNKDKNVQVSDTRKADK